MAELSRAFHYNCIHLYRHRVQSALGYIPNAETSLHILVYLEGAHTPSFHR